MPRYAECEIPHRGYMAREIVKIRYAEGEYTVYAAGDPDFITTAGCSTGAESRPT
jgi:hypothetical protein